MAKPWSQVIQSPEYQSLDDRQKYNAKQEYWFNVVNAKPEFQSLAPKQKIEARNEFFAEEFSVPKVDMRAEIEKGLPFSGGLSTDELINEGRGTQAGINRTIMDALVTPTFHLLNQGGFNLPRSMLASEGIEAPVKVHASETPINDSWYAPALQGLASVPAYGAGVYGAFKNPLSMALTPASRFLGKLATGAKAVSQATRANQLPSAVAKVTDLERTAPQLLQFVTNHPVLSRLALPALQGVEGAGFGYAFNPSNEEVANFGERTRNALLGAGLGAVAPSALEGAGTALNWAMKGWSAKSYGSLLRALPKMFRFGADPEGELQKIAFRANSKAEAVAKIRDLTNQAGEEIGAIINKPENVGKIVDTAEVLDPLRKLLASAEEDPNMNKALIDRLKGIITDLEKYTGTDADALMAKKLKDKISGATKFIGDGADADINNALRQSYWKAKNQLNNAIPELVRANEKYANLKTAKIAIDRASGLGRSTNVIGLDDAVVAGGALAGTGHPADALAGIALNKILKTAWAKTLAGKWLFKLSPEEIANAIRTKPNLATTLMKQGLTDAEVEALADPIATSSAMEGVSSTTTSGNLANKRYAQSVKGLDVPRVGKTDKTYGLPDEYQDPNFVMGDRNYQSPQSMPMVVEPPQSVLDNLALKKSEMAGGPAPSAPVQPYSQPLWEQEKAQQEALMRLRQTAGQSDRPALTSLAGGQIKGRVPRYRVPQAPEIPYVEPSPQEALMAEEEIQRQAMQEALRSIGFSPTEVKAPLSDSALRRMAEEVAQEMAGNQSALQELANPDIGKFRKAWNKIKKATGNERGSISMEQLIPRKLGEKLQGSDDALIAGEKKRIHVNLSQPVRVRNASGDMVVIHPEDGISIEPKSGEAGKFVLHDGQDVEMTQKAKDRFLKNRNVEQSTQSFPSEPSVLSTVPPPNRPKTPLQKKIETFSDIIPQTRGAGEIPAPVTSKIEDINKFKKDVRQMVLKNPQKYPLSHKPYAETNMDYGLSGGGKKVCKKGECFTTSLGQMHSEFDSLPTRMIKNEQGKPEAYININGKWQKKSTVVTKAGQELFGRAKGKGLQVTCSHCYSADARITRANMKPITNEVSLYQAGELNTPKMQEAIKKNDGVFRMYSHADGEPYQTAEIVQIIEDLNKDGNTTGMYLKSLPTVEAIGDIGVPINISSGKTVDIGIPIDVIDAYRQRYPNVGSSYSAINREDLIQAGLDPRVDHLIPLHLGGGLTPEFLEKTTGLKYEKFNDIQNELLRIGGEGRKLKLFSSTIDNKFPAEDLAEARRLVKEATFTGDGKKYLTAVRKASKILKTTVEPKFAEFRNEPWYSKLIGSGRAEYGKKGVNTKIDISKLNLQKAQEAINTPEKDMADEMRKMLEIKKQVFEDAISGRLKVGE